MKRTTTAAVLSAAALMLVACGDKPQTAGTKKSDAAPWEGEQSAAFTEKGWKAGDQASWESQIRNRAQSQNEYVRTAPGQK